MARKQTDTTDTRNYDVLHVLDIEQLKLLASTYKLKGYAEMSKLELIEGFKELCKMKDRASANRKRKRK
jgi:hypothetical protein